MQELYISNCILIFKNEVLYFSVVILLEILAIILEFIIYKKYIKFSDISPLKLSLINNIISFENVQTVNTNRVEINGAVETSDEILVIFVGLIMITLIIIAVAVLIESKNKSNTKNDSEENDEIKK